MDKPKVSPKDFFLWAGAMIALYISVFSLIQLIFSYIDYTYPDALNTYVDPYSSTMRFEIASLIVLFPIFLVLMRFIRKDMEKTPAKKDLWIRRWALFLTVFVAGVTVAGDLITLINFFLGGDLTVRFVLKVVVVLLVIGAGFLHFLADIWGYWIIYPSRARSVGWGAAALIVCTVAAGFFIMGSPSHIRMYRFDDQRVSDLQNVQYQIVNYWQQKQKIPATLAELVDPIAGNTIPSDPETGAPYEYKSTGNLSFELCATFDALTQPNSNSSYMTRPMAPIPAKYDGSSTPEDSWQHGAGRTCFERTIDPERYPPFNKTPATSTQS